MAALVIVIANLVMVLRVWGSPPSSHRRRPPLLRVIVPALVLGTLGAFWLWRRLAERHGPALPATGNPDRTEDRARLRCGLCAGAAGRGLAVGLCRAIAACVLAFVSGLTDVDAITLSSLRLYALERLELVATVTALGIAMLANLCFKLGLASVIGAAPSRCVPPPAWRRARPARRPGRVGLG